MQSVQQRFLRPVLIVVTASLLSSGAITAWWLRQTVGEREQEQLSRVVGTLTAPGFPLSESVLAKMSGLSGAEFLVVESEGDLLASSFPITTSEVDDLTRKILAAKQGKSPHRVSLAGKTYLAEAIELHGSDIQHPRRLIVLSPSDLTWAATERVVVPPLLVGIVACIVLFVLVPAITRPIVRPIEQLAQQATQVGTGTFPQFDVSSRCRELADLTRAMNHMVSQLHDYAARIGHRERLKTLDQLSGGIAHQLRNAATGARLALDFHRRESVTTESETLDTADEQLRQIEQYCQRFLILAKEGRPPETLSRREVAIAEIVNRAVQDVMPVSRHAGVEVEISLPVTDLRVNGDCEALQQVFGNLLVNGVEAVRHVKSRQPCLQMIVASHRSDAIIRVGDNGDGPPQSVAGDLFEPLVTDKPGGTGLGLAIAREVIAAHEGQITWRREGEWTWFEVTLPLYEHEKHHGPLAHH